MRLDITTPSSVGVAISDSIHKRVVTQESCNMQHAATAGNIKVSTYVFMSDLGIYPVQSSFDILLNCDITNITTHGSALPPPCCDFTVAAMVSHQDHVNNFPILNERAVAILSFKLGSQETPFDGADLLIRVQGVVTSNDHAVSML